jgi:phenylalanyl-tRNA synthetase beta chain
MLNAIQSAPLIPYLPISKYPQIRRDLSFLVDKHITALDIENVVRSVCLNEWLKGFDVFDVYIGKGIPDGKKSVAISITLQDASRTLVDAEINSLISAIIKALENEFSILLRD